MKTFQISTLCTLAAVLCAPLAHATTVTVVTETGTPYASPVDIRDDTGSRGVDLDGATVTATYSDASTEVLRWNALDPFTPGAAVGDDFEIYMDFEGFDIRANKQLSKLRIDLSTSFSIADGSGRSVFDILTADNAEPGNTPSSAFGFPVRFDNRSYTQTRFFGSPLPFGEMTDIPLGDVTATYSNIVGIGDALPQGDLFSTLSIDFAGLNDGFFLGEANFDADVDTFREVAPVPLPAGLPLLLAGLGALAFTRRGRH